MTRARALKQAIRARAARTGERYTTARRHVLRILETAPPAPRTPPETPAPAVSPSSRTQPTINDARIVEKTGHGLDHWFEVLDRFDAIAKGHTAAARHLRDDHGVGAWHAQSITVAYERARGVRAVNQRGDGNYEVSVSKMMPANVPSIVAFLSGKRTRKHLKVSDDTTLRALAATLESPSSRGFIVRPDGQGRLRYKRNTTVVQIYLYPKPNGKSSVVVTEMKLDTPDMVEKRRQDWRELLNALAGAVQR